MQATDEWVSLVADDPDHYFTARHEIDHVRGVHSVVMANGLGLSIVVEGVVPSLRSDDCQLSRTAIAVDRWLYEVDIDSETDLTGLLARFGWRIEDSGPAATVRPTSALERAMSAGAGFMPYIGYGPGEIVSDLEDALVQASTSEERARVSGMLVLAKRLAADEWGA